jgi:hypothetical protein
VTGCKPVLGGRTIHPPCLHASVRPQRMAIGTATAAFIIVAVVVIGAIGVVMLQSTSNLHPTSTSGSSRGAYEVAFQQIGACFPSFWGVPWAVTVGNMTRVQPASAKLPISYLYGTTDRALAEIDLLLPSGKYNYTVSPPQEYFTPSSGSFVVSGSNISIPIAYTGTSCTTTITSTRTNVTGAFTYTPTRQVQVNSVWATETPASNGRQNVTFYVSYENIGTAPVYAIGGWIGALSSTVEGNSSVLQASPAIRCPGAIYIVTLDQGQGHTVFAPDCGSGFNYQLVQLGSVTVHLTINWTTNGHESTPFSNSTTITANFTFGIPP